MGMFEQLLVKELQRQQHKAQFCDTVLQAQGVFVPVHSCVLAAFSPRLCEYLSSHPALPNGKCRVINLQAVEAYTLLRLVTVLYTGSVEGERRDVQKAANTLGITLPEERAKRAGEWGSGEVPLKDGTLGRKESAKQGVGGRESNRRVYKDAETQMGERHTAETDTQTDPDITSSQDAQFVYERPNFLEVQSALPWVTEECFQMPAAENPIMACSDDVSTVTTIDEVMVCQLFSEAALEYPESCSSLFHPPPEDQPIEMESLSTGVSANNGELVEGFEQFEGDIPEFISYFLGLSGPRKRGQRMRRSPRRAKRGSGRARRMRGSMAKEGEERQAIGKVERRFPLREGSPAGLSWRGVGGGRIGRPLHRPSKKKGRPRSYIRQCSSQGKNKPSQAKVPTIRKPRGRPQLVVPFPVLPHLPQPESDPLPTPASASSLLHTLPMPPPTTQPRALIEQLNQPSCAAEPLSSYSTLPANTPTSPRMLHSTGKADARSSQQQQPEGEVMDILDHLLLSLEQPVDLQPYTIIKDLQEVHSQEIRSYNQSHRTAPGHSHIHAQQQGSEALLSDSIEWQLVPKVSLAAGPKSVPCYRPHCRPADCKTKYREKKHTLMETNLREEMFEERRMTRNQAELLRMSHNRPTGSHTASTEPDLPVHRHLHPGKNMSILRRKLLGKRKREEDDDDKEAERSEGMEKSPSTSKWPKLSPLRSSSSSVPIPTATLSLDPQLPCPHNCAGPTHNKPLKSRKHTLKFDGV